MPQPSATCPPLRTHCCAAATAPQLGAEQLIAGTGVDSALVPLGASYMRIRAFAQPAVLLTMVCQAGLLAQQVRAGR